MDQVERICGIKNLATMYCVSNGMEQSLEQGPEQSAKGIINYLVAIRCLDEGINIPSITSALILSSNDNYRECVQRRGRILRKDGKKKKASIYDVIVLPSSNNRAFAEIEFRRFYEYSRIASNKDELLLQLNGLLDEYDLTIEDIKFNK